MPSPAKAVITTSETVTDLLREMVEAVWHCKIFDQYCSVEDSFFASQCEYGRYHISPEMGVLEIVDSSIKPVPPGVIGEVICTGLQNKLQPLIRYRVGDMARWSTDQSCKCGRQMPILETIEGRFEDICVTSDGREMLRFDTVFKGIDNIREAQVIQEHLDLFIINIVPGDGFDSNDIIHLKKNMRNHVGSANVVVKLVDAIPRSTSGKFRAVICKLSASEKHMVLQTRI
jgi:phenylacetate-coenzyme A ligase PaaK-like adenylate-forming protein